MMYRDDAMLALRAEFWWRNPALLNEFSPVFTHTTTSTFSLCVKIVYGHPFDLTGLAGLTGLAEIPLTSARTGKQD